MSLTREQFLAGAIFQHKNNKSYRFQFVPDANPNPTHFGHLRVITGSKFQFTEYHANVRLVEKRRFQSYNDLVGKLVYVWRNFDDMIFVSDDPEKKVD